MKKTKAFELLCYRRILNISWVDRVTNLEVLRRMDKDMEVIIIIKIKNVRYLDLWHPTMETR